MGIRPFFHHFFVPVAQRFGRSLGYIRHPWGSNFVAFGIPLGPFLVAFGLLFASNPLDDSIFVPQKVMKNSADGRTNGRTDKHTTIL